MSEDVLPGGVCADGALKGDGLDRYVLFLEGLYRFSEGSAPSHLFKRPVLAFCLHYRHLLSLGLKALWSLYLQRLAQGLLFPWAPVQTFKVPDLVFELGGLPLYLFDHG